MIMETEVKSKIYSIILSTISHQIDNEFTDESDIFTLGLDSVTIMHLIYKLQNEFDLEFELDEINPDNFRTVLQIEALLKKKQNKI